jgi:hypothetical protein
MSCLGCLGWTAQAIAVGILLCEVLAPLGAWSIAFAVAAGAVRSAEFVSMETNLVAALLLWALVMARQRRWYATSALAALSILFRPDMSLPALVLGLMCLSDLRTQAFKPALLFVALAAPWPVFAQIYYGSVVPQSAVTKFHFSDWWGYALFELELPASLVSPFSARVGWLALMWLLAIAGAFVVVRRARLWFLPLFAALHFAAYLYIHPFHHHWHLYPANLVVVVLALVGVVSLGGLALGSPRLRALGGAAVLALSLIYASHTYAFAGEHATAFWYGSRDSAYREIGHYLLKHARKSDVVASVEVGTLAYYTDLRMYDWGALITAHPEFRPRTPRLSWSVVDSVFRDQFAQGILPIRRFDRGAFVVDVHNFALLGEAARRVMAAHPGQLPSALKGQLRPELERELSALVQAMEQSDKPVSEFLADAR